MTELLKLVSDAHLHFGFASGTGLGAFYLAIVLIAFSISMVFGYKAIVSIWRNK